MARSNDTPAAKTYTLSDFIGAGNADELVYKNFAILRNSLDAQFVDYTVLDFYMYELRQICAKVMNKDITKEERVKYQYCPDLLAYDIYKSTQMDFIILLANGIISPKDFDFRKSFIYIPSPKYVFKFLNQVYNSEKKWLDKNPKYQHNYI